jgi:hypothetical protein
MITPKKTMLYIHIGTPKTGTSSLQFFLYDHYAQLKSKGILYPKKLIASPRDPKHQSFFSHIFSGNLKGLEDSMYAINSEMTDSVTAILLSSEGFYHHIYEFTTKSWSLIKELAENYDVQTVVCLRPQADYIESMYRQYLKNPKGIIAEYGSSMTIHEFLKIPRVKQNMNYYDSILKWEKIVGENKILIRRYSKNVVSDFLSLFKFGSMVYQEPVKRNMSINREMAELLRQVNPYIENQKRNRLIEHMEKQIEQNYSGEDASFLSPSEQWELMDSHKASNDIVAQRWLNEKELFPGAQLCESDSWKPVVIDRDRMLSMHGRITMCDDLPSILSVQ